MMIALTGTPGTGKTSLAEELRSRGHTVLDLNKHIVDKGLRGERDDARDTYSVDVDSLDVSLDEYRTDDLVIIEGHIAHCVGCDMAVVLRCEPDILAERLRSRGYSEEKTRENVQAEVLDVILCEAVEAVPTVCEVDSSGGTVGELADKVEEMIGGNINKYRPGGIDWTGELEKWF